METHRRVELVVGMVEGVVLLVHVVVLVVEGVGGGGGGVFGWLHWNGINKFLDNIFKNIKNHSLT